MNQEEIYRILQLVAYVNVAYDAATKSYAPLPRGIAEAHDLAPAVVQSPQWRPAYPGITYVWSAAATCFNCPCGARDIVLGEGGETVTCDCGITYRLRHYVEADRNMMQGGNHD